MIRDTRITVDSLHANGVIVINNFRLGLSRSHETGSPARDDPGITIEACESRIESDWIVSGSLIAIST